MNFNDFTLFTLLREEVIPSLCADLKFFLYTNHIRGPEDLEVITNAYLSYPFANLDTLQELMDECKFYITWKDRANLDEFITNSIKRISDNYRLSKLYNVRLLWYNNTLLCEEYVTNNPIFAVYLKED